MELKEFVTKVLKDLVGAVDDASAQSIREIHLTESQNDRTVEFDIAVTVEDITSGSGKAGIKVFQFIEGGGEISKEAKNATVSRIKFGVHIGRWTKEEEGEHRTAKTHYINQAR